jgi:GTPase SAR1 family protein
MSQRLKFVLAGSPMVGKSSYFLRVTGRHLVGPLNIVPNTVGMAYSNVYVTKEGIVVGDPDRSAYGRDDIKFSVGLWDTAGQEHYRSLLPMYFRGAHVIFVVHEGTGRSKDDVRELIKVIKRDTPEAKIYMIQNKSDACEFDMEFLDEVRKDLIGWAHVSALSNNGVHASFHDACEAYHANAELPLPEPEPTIQVASATRGSELWRYFKC